MHMLRTLNVSVLLQCRTRRHVEIHKYPSELIAAGFASYCCVRPQGSLARLPRVGFSVSIIPNGSFLGVAARGPLRLTEACGLVATVDELVTRERHRLALVDMSGVQPELSFTDHLQFGVTAARLLTRLTRLAAVVPPGYLDAPAARAAQLAGLPVRTFLELEPATRWIEELSARPVPEVAHR